MAILASLSLTAIFGWANGTATEPPRCVPETSAQLTVDQGHRWRPPFGLDRIGSPLIAHVVVVSGRPPSGVYYLVAYQGDQPVKRQRLKLAINASDYGGYSSFLTKADARRRFAHVPVPQQTTELELEHLCDERTTSLERRAIALPALEADAEAHPQHLKNPVDLGAILPPYDGLLLQSGEHTTIEFAAVSNAKDLSALRLTAWFEGGRKLERPLTLPKGRRITASVTLPMSSTTERTTLHIRLLDKEEQSLFSKDIDVMVARPPTQPWPAFGAVETELRYDSPVASYSPQSGAALTSIPYKSAWDARLKDVVVFLPNSSRFVFWRGANYVPFWAGRYNTGTLYQWVENCSKELHVTHPDGSWDCPEPIFDGELRYGRVRIIESSSSRIHVRWDYQLTDLHYEVRGGSASEDFYFYPDGFGTRVLTYAAPVGADPTQVSELLVITPPSAYPLQVFPDHPLETISLDSGQRERIAFPYKRSQQSDLENPQTRLSLLPLSGKGPTLFRLLSHKGDPFSTIYLQFNGRTDMAALAPYIFPPMYDRGEIVSPAYWGNHWPLTRGKWTSWSIDERIPKRPTHNSLATWIPVDPDSKKLRFEMAPLQQSQWKMPDCVAQDRVCTLNKFVWMIGNTDLSDQEVIETARSYLHPPTITVTGGRLLIPAYRPERRVLRLVAESPSIDLALTSQFPIINPAFEIDDAPRELERITLNGEALSENLYEWDGLVLWIGARIPPIDGKLTVRFADRTRRGLQSP